MTSSAVVTRYANALVDIVVSSRAGIDPKLAVEQLRGFDEMVKSSPELRVVLASPAVSKARKRQLLRRIAEALGLERIIRNLILVLSDHGRAGALPQMFEEFEILLDQRLGLVRAEVATAAELNPQQSERLSSEMEKLAGSKVRMRFVVDPDLIGGVTARFGSKVYDGSVRGQLENMRHVLAVDQR